MRLEMFANYNDGLLNVQKAAAQQEARAHRSARCGKVASTQYVSSGTMTPRHPGDPPATQVTPGKNPVQARGKNPVAPGKNPVAPGKNLVGTGKNSVLREKFGCRWRSGLELAGWRRAGWGWAGRMGAGRVGAGRVGVGRVGMGRAEQPWRGGTCVLIHKNVRRSRTERSFGAE